MKDWTSLRQFCKSFCWWKTESSFITAQFLEIWNYCLSCLSLLQLFIPLIVSQAPARTTMSKHLRRNNGENIRLMQIKCSFLGSEKLHNNFRLNMKGIMMKARTKCASRCSSKLCGRSTSTMRRSWKGWQMSKRAWTSTRIGAMRRSQSWFSENFKFATCATTQKNWQ